MRKLVVVLFCLVMLLRVGAAFAASDPTTNPDPKAPAVDNGLTEAGDKAKVKMNKVFSQPPIVICNAQWNGKAYSCSAIQVTTSYFAVSIRDENKRPVSQAWVQWVAFLPSSNYAIIGGKRTTNHNDQVTFSSMGASPVILCNAFKDNAALNACAATNTATGFTAVIRDQDNATVQGATMFWMAVVPNSMNKFRGNVAQRNHNATVSLSPSLNTPCYYWVSGQLGMEPYACYAYHNPPNYNAPNAFKLLQCSHSAPGGTSVWTQWLGWGGW